MPLTRLIIGLSLALAAAPAAGEIAFVTNQNSDELSILDLDKGTEIARLPVEGKPAGVAVGKGAEIYTVSPDSKTIRRFDSRSGEILAEAVLDGGPIGIAYDPASERVFVSDWYNARIWVLEARSLTQISTLTTGSAPAGLEVFGSLLASADRDAHQVSIFDLNDLTLRHQLDVGERPFGLGFAPDGRLFVGNVGSNDVTILDPQQGEILATLPVGERPYGVAFAKGQAFVTNQYENTVSVIDLDSLTVTATFEVGEYPEGIDSTSDESLVVVANWFDNTVSLIDPVSLSVIGEMETGDGPRAFGRFISEGAP